MNCHGGEGVAKMYKKKGFTLIELLVVIAIIALLVSILLPSLHRARELANRAVCGTNIKGIGTAIAMYGAQNRDSFPWNAQDVKNNYQNNYAGKEYQGNSDQNAPDKAGMSMSGFSSTRQIFLLIRAGEPSSLFTCPSTDDTPDGDLKHKDPSDSTKMIYNYDFSGIKSDAKIDSSASTIDSVYGWKHISYSLQAPFYTGSSLTGSGINSNSPNNLPILADKTPFKNQSTDPTIIDWAAKTNTDAQKKSNMSQNHTGGEAINVLRNDGSVKSAQTANVGVSDDNIYTADATSGNTGTDQKGAINYKKPTNRKDSFLVGPFETTAY